MSEQTILFQKEDERKKFFLLSGSIQSVVDSLKELIEMSDEEDGDYSLTACADYDGTPVEKTDREKEIDGIKKIIGQLLEGQFEQWFDEIPRKKNGTFHKARVSTLWRGMTFEHYWEDSYGYNGPEVIIRTIDDHNAVLRFEDRVRKY